MVWQVHNTPLETSRHHTHKVPGYPELLQSIDFDYNLDGRLYGSVPVLGGLEESRQMGGVKLHYHVIANILDAECQNPESDILTMLEHSLQ